MISEIIDTPTGELAITPIISQLRSFIVGNSIVTKDPYEGVITLNWVGTDTVYLSALAGKGLTSKGRQALFDNLIKKGITKIFWERRGEIREVLS